MNAIIMSDLIDHMRLTEYSVERFPGRRCGGCGVGKQPTHTGITTMITCGGHFLKIRFLPRTSKIRAVQLIEFKSKSDFL